MNQQAHFNNLTPAEAERLALLLEELGETSQIIGKILRHGYESFNPFDADKVTNRKLLMKEIGDVCAALDIMNNAGDIDEMSVGEFTEQKLKKVQKYLHHNEVKRD